MILLLLLLLLLLYSIEETVLYYVYVTKVNVMFLYYKFLSLQLYYFSYMQYS